MSDEVSNEVLVERLSNFQETFNNYKVEVTSRFNQSDIKLDTIIKENRAYFGRLDKIEDKQNILEKDFASHRTLYENKVKNLENDLKKIEGLKTQFSGFSYVINLIINIIIKLALLVSAIFTISSLYLHFIH